MSATAVAGRTTLRLYNRVLPVLFIVAFAASVDGGFVTLAPNRLLAGRPIPIVAAVDGPLAGAIAALGAMLLATAAMRSSRALHRGAALLAAFLLVLVLAAAGQAAAALGAGATPLSRVSLGPAFWVMLGAAALAVVDALQRAGSGMAERLSLTAAIVVAAALLAHAGLFNGLSLVREYGTRRDVFAAALARHAVLVAATVGPAVLIGLPLGVAAVRRPRAQAPIFAVLNLLQTIPSIALFGLLIAPLSALAKSFPSLARLGIGGIGLAPAIIALVLYALLPVVRNTVAGIAGVDPSVIDAARGMGMTPRQLLWRVELPLASPLLLAGLRVVTVQAVGLAVVAALIGAGGLGTFIFDGLGQDAADLVLLGALPTILLALAADFLLQAVSVPVSRRLGQ